MGVPEGRLRPHYTDYGMVVGPGRIGPFGVWCPVL